MGQRGEVYSTRVFVDDGKKTYFFNVKENRYRDLYLNIVESRKGDNGFKRSSIVVFQENLKSFVHSLESAIQAFRQRNQDYKNQLELPDGRRSYEFSTASRGRPSLMVSESRQDLSGVRREAIRIQANGIDPFLDGLARAMEHLKQE